MNRYLKWAYIEAANCVALQQKLLAGRHVVTLLQRIQKQKGYPKAAVAVGRHLAEATYCMLKRNEPYQEPNFKRTVLSSQG